MVREHGAFRELKAGPNIVRGRKGGLVLTKVLLGTIHLGFNAICTTRHEMMLTIGFFPPKQVLFSP